MGLSPRNLWDMKRFYERYDLADAKLRQAVAVLPWGHNLLLINKVQSLSAVEFYANEVAAKDWSNDLTNPSQNLKSHFLRTNRQTDGQ